MVAVDILWSLFAMNVFWGTVSLLGLIVLRECYGNGLLVVAFMLLSCSLACWLGRFLALSCLLGGWFAFLAESFESWRNLFYCLCLFCNLRHQRHNPLCEASGS